LLIFLQSAVLKLQAWLGMEPTTLGLGSNPTENKLTLFWKNGENEYLFVSKKGVNE